MLTGYERLPNGVIKQSFFIKIDYNYDYSNKYNKYGEKGKYLSHLRYGVLLGVLGRAPKSITDVGYGNGDFLSVCRSHISNVFGCDLSEYPVPEGCTKIAFQDINSEVTCFFDSLEHFEDITVVKDLKSDYVFISVPWCHYLSDEWFRDWYHRRENEHLYHFNKDALIAFMNESGYACIYCDCFEDIVRKNTSVAPLANILSGIFKKRETPNT